VKNDMNNIKRISRLALAMVLMLSVVTLGGSSLSGAAAVRNSGILCTTAPTTAGTNPAFTLTAKSGTILMPDGNSVFNWSYTNGTNAFQFPGPYLCVNQGDLVTIHLKNTLPEATSIMFPGLEGVLANGVPAQPEYTAGALTSLVPSAAALTGTMTYTFTATNAGTYLYESGTDMGKQVQMGLYGALIVRPASTSPGVACAYSCAETAYDPATEFVMLLSELDPGLHQAVERNTAYDVTTLHQRYWLINGRAFPDTIAPNNSPLLPAQPYSSLVHINITDVALNPGQAPALVRYLNAGALGHPFHPHGQNGRVVGRDGVALTSASGADLSYETFSQTIGSGQTWDELYAFYDQEHFNSLTNPVPVTIPGLQNQLFKNPSTYYSGSPYIGELGPMPVGEKTFNECGEFYMVWHSHALNEAANFNTGFGGMLTLERIDPVPGHQAPGTTCGQ